MAEATKKCSNCRRTIPYTASYCTYCGYKAGGGIPMQQRTDQVKSKDKAVVVEPNEWGDYWLDRPTESPAVLPSKRIVTVKGNVNVAETGTYLVFVRGTFLFEKDGNLKRVSRDEAFALVADLEPAFANHKPAGAEQCR